MVVDSGPRSRRYSTVYAVFAGLVLLQGILFCKVLLLEIKHCNEPDAGEHRPYHPTLPKEVPSDSKYDDGTGAYSEDAAVASPILPRRLVSVFGLESSGTTFVTALLESSVSVRQRINGNQRDNTPALKKSGEFIIQVVPVLFPAHCVHMTKQPITSSVAEKRRRPLTDDCLKLLGNDISQGLDYLYPRRFFVNITSHIMWYRERGVIASAILVVRDQTIGTISRSLEHCPILDRATQEEALGLKLLREAMDVLPRQFSETDVAPLAVLSYETALTAGVPYLNFVLRSLGLPEVRDTLEGTFNDANKVYIKPREEVEILKRRKDHGRRRPSLLRQDLEAQGGGRPLGLPHNLA